MLAFVPVDSMFMGIHRHVVYLQPYGVLVNICEKNRDESHIYFFIIIMILILSIIQIIGWFVISDAFFNFFFNFIWPSYMWIVELNIQQFSRYWNLYIELFHWLHNFYPTPPSSFHILNFRARNEYLITLDFKRISIKK